MHLRNGIFTIIALMIVMGDGLKADTLAYEATGGNNFGLLDLNTGVFTLRGNMGALLSGVGVAGTNIYGGKFGSSTLYSVNTTNGALTAVGTGSMTYYAMGSTTAGLYALDPSGNLWSVNSSNGQTTEIGSTGLSLVGIWGVSTNASGLYITLNSNFFSLNTTTGAATLIGNTGQSFGALVSIGGTLYAGANPANQVYELDTSSGAATFLSDETGTGTSGSFWGFAPASSEPSVPEPGCIGLWLLSAPVLGVILNRRGCGNKA